MTISKKHLCRNAIYLFIALSITVISGETSPKIGERHQPTQHVYTLKPPSFASTIKREDLLKGGEGDIAYKKYTSAKEYLDTLSKLQFPLEIVSTAKQTKLLKAEKQSLILEAKDFETLWDKITKRGATNLKHYGGFTKLNNRQKSFWTGLDSCIGIFYLSPTGEIYMGSFWPEFFTLNNPELIGYNNIAEKLSLYNFISGGKALLTTAMNTKYSNKYKLDILKDYLLKQGVEVTINKNNIGGHITVIRANPVKNEIKIIHEHGTEKEPDMLKVYTYKLTLSNINNPDILTIKKTKLLKPSYVKIQRGEIPERYTFVGQIRNGRLRLIEDSDIQGSGIKLLGTKGETVPLYRFNNFLKNENQSILKAYKQNGNMGWCHAVAKYTAEKMQEYGIDAWVINEYYSKKEKEQILDSFNSAVIFKLKNKEGKTEEFIMHYAPDPAKGLSDDTRKDIIPIVIPLYASKGIYPQKNTYTRIIQPDDYFIVTYAPQWLKIYITFVTRVYAAKGQVEDAVPYIINASENLLHNKKFLADSHLSKPQKLTQLLKDTVSNKDLLDSILYNVISEQKFIVKEKLNKVRLNNNI